MECEAEVLIESSPLHKYLEEVGLKDVPVSSSAGFSDTLHVHIVDQIQSQAETGNVSSNNTEPRVSELKTRLIKMMTGSPCLLEEHHKFLTAFTDDRWSDELTDSNIYWRALKWLLAGAVCTVGVSISNHTSQYLSQAVRVCAGAVPTLLLVKEISSYIQKSSVKPLIQRLREKLDCFQKTESVLKSVKIFCQEANLISRGAVIINRKYQAKRTQETFTKGIREVTHLYLCKAIGDLTVDIKYLLIQLDQKDYNAEHFCESNFMMDISYLQELHNNLLLLMSQWITLLVLVVNKRTITDIVEIVGKLQGIEYPHAVKNTLNFYTRLLDGQFEPKQPAKQFQTSTMKDQAIHSLYLHSRELLRLTKVIEGNASHEEGIYNEISQQIKDCKLCLEAAWKSQVGKTMMRDKMPLESAESSQLDFTSSTRVLEADRQTIIDQVFIGEVGQQDTRKESLVPIDEDDSSALKETFEKYLMRELRGVINELAKERETRENNLTGNDLPEEISRKTKDLIEKRDIRALIKSVIDDQPDEVSEITKKTKYGPKSSRYVLLEEDSTNSVIDSTTQSDMKRIANLVASKFQSTQQTEQTFGSDTDDE